MDGIWPIGACLISTKFMEDVPHLGVAHPHGEKGPICWEALYIEINVLIADFQQIKAYSLFLSGQILTMTFCLNIGC